MPEETIREKTLLLRQRVGPERRARIMELRMRGGFPRANAVRHVQRQVRRELDVLRTSARIDRASFPALMDYWVPGTRVMGVHELVGNALVLDGEGERTLDLRLEELPKKPAPASAGDAGATSDGEGGTDHV